MEEISNNLGHKLENREVETERGSAEGVELKINNRNLFVIKTLNQLKIQNLFKAIFG